MDGGVEVVLRVCIRYRFDGLKWLSSMRIKVG
jgi:hypothetical protein